MSFCWFADFYETAAFGQLKCHQNQRCERIGGRNGMGVIPRTVVPGKSRDCTRLFNAKTFPAILEF
jgi:hypothetical protein